MGHCAASSNVAKELSGNLGVAPALAAFCRTVPKAELHVHIEGTLEPELMLHLAERNGIAPLYTTVEDAVAARAFTCLADFLSLYYAGCDVLRTQQDYQDLMAAYLRRAASDGVKHAEVFFDPQTHLTRGVSWDTMLTGMSLAVSEGQSSLGISCNLIMCFLRNLGPEAAMATLSGFLDLRDRTPLVVGVGLDSNEIHESPAVWKPVFDHAVTAGLRLCCHAGEEEPAKYVSDVVNLLKVDRIDHGVKSLDDATLMAHLLTSQIPLTTCPISNVRLKVYDGEYEAKLRQLLHSGLCVTVNSDDPAYFRSLRHPSTGAYVAENYEYAAGVGQLHADDVAELAKRSFHASFLPKATKQQYIDAVEAALTAAKESAGQP